MDYQTAIDYYKLLKEEYSESIEEFANFYNYFESNWLSMENAEDSKFEFNLWNYTDKFKCKGNKKN